MYATTEHPASSDNIKTITFNNQPCSATLLYLLLFVYGKALCIPPCFLYTVRLFVYLLDDEGGGPTPFARDLIPCLPYRTYTRTVLFFKLVRYSYGTLSLRPSLYIQPARPALSGCLERTVIAGAPTKSSGTKGANKPSTVDHQVTTCW